VGKEPVYIASALMSAGAVWWVARGLALATAVMMGTPAWRQVDLLPVVLVQGKTRGLDPDGQALDHETILETEATTSFFDEQNGDLEEEAIGSLFEQPEHPSRH
jgi:hypothetical protein